MAAGMPHLDQAPLALLLLLLLSLSHSSTVLWLSVDCPDPQRCHVHSTCQSLTYLSSRTKTWYVVCHGAVSRTHSAITHAKCDICVHVT